MCTPVPYCWPGIRHIDIAFFSGFGIRSPRCLLAMTASDWPPVQHLSWSGKGTLSDSAMVGTAITTPVGYILSIGLFCDSVNVMLFPFSRAMHLILGPIICNFLAIEMQKYSYHSNWQFLSHQFNARQVYPLCFSYGDPSILGHS